MSFLTVLTVALGTWTERPGDTRCSSRRANSKKHSVQPSTQTMASLAPPPILNQLPITVQCECIATDANGQECGNWTEKGNMCRRHSKAVLGVEVKKSLIPGAGDGLFVTKRFERADVICEYGPGTVMTSAAFAANPSAYGCRLWRGVLDCRRTDQGFGRYCCAANTARQVNAQLIAESKLVRRGSGSRVFVQALKTIEPGSEIYVKYGQQWWQEQAPGGEHGL